MGIREDSKRIVRYFLEKAIEIGDLDLCSSDFSFSYNSLAKDLELKSEKYCRICCQYLREHECIETHSIEKASDNFSTQRHVCLLAKAIDFLETT